MLKLLVSFVAVLSLTSCGSEVQIDEDGVINKVVSVEEFKEHMKSDDIQIVDVRTPEEYNLGKIGDAYNMNIYEDNFKKLLSTLDPSKKTLVYCAKGGRSAKAAEMMLELKFVEVYDLRGGYGAWK